MIKRIAVLLVILGLGIHLRARFLIDALIAPPAAALTVVSLGAFPYGCDDCPRGPNARRFFTSPFKAVATTATLGIYPYCPDEESCNNN